MESDIVYPNLDNNYTAETPTQRRVIGNDYVFNLYDFHYNGQVEILYISDNITINDILEKLNVCGYCPFQINSNRIQVNSLVNIEEVLKELDPVQEYAEKETHSSTNVDIIIMGDNDNDVQPNSSRTRCTCCSKCMYAILAIVIAGIIGGTIYIVLNFACS